METMLDLLNSKTLWVEFGIDDDIIVSVPVFWALVLMHMCRLPDFH